MADSAARALALLRDGSHFQWYIIPLLLLVMYVYANEVERRNWSLVLAGLAFWLMDWFNEIWNGLVFHFTNYAPVWATPGNGSSLVILIGLNIEISFMFAIMGIIMAKQLPADKNLKILGVPNRMLYAIVGFSFSCLRGMPSQLGWCTYLGIPLVESARSLAHLADRLHAVLPDGILGLRYEIYEK